MAKKKADNVEVDNIEVKKEVEEKVAKATKSSTSSVKKEFKNDDEIPCKSVTCGELLMVGKKTKRLYRWADCNDIEYVEYQDLLYSVRERSREVFAPRFIILDEDFINQNKELNSVYLDLYSFSDIREILNQSPERLKATLSTLPNGILEAVKGVAATGINNGTFDSIKKIKVLDEVFGTDMLRLLLDNE